MDDTISKVNNRYIDSVNIEISEEDNKAQNGEIVVTSIFDFGENEFLQGVKINLYKINV